jgi:hypothetical protein
MDAPACELRRPGEVGFVPRVGLDNAIAHTGLRGRLGDRTEEGEAATLSVHLVLASWERDVASCAGAALPDRQPDQLEPGQEPLGWARLDANRSG